jgi:hypothetical protein
MLNYTDFWPAIGLTIGVAMLVTAALCLLVATFSPDWFRPRRRHQVAAAPAERAGHDHSGHDHSGRDHSGRQEPKAA